MNSSREELLFGLALTKAPVERSGWLDRECGEDKALRERVERLLAAHDQPETLLATQAEAARPTMKAASADELADEAVGQSIGRYKLLEKIGEGGFGLVYVAEQKEPVKRRVALKIIKLGMDTRQVVARFEAERQALALMDHPNIAKVLDAGATASGRPFFVMELVRGVRFTDYCDQHKLSTRQRLELFIPVCQAIQHAHQKGIIHRDIKPSNILVTLHDGVPVPKVIDFGIAKATQQDLTDKTVYTQLQQFIGTPAYMSPEQAEMSGLDVDTRSDIYSLGVLLYELLTGRTPFDPKELMSQGIDAMRKTIREKEPVRPSTKVATLQVEELTTTAQRRASEAPKLISLLRGDLDWIVMKCLEKDRTRRYETANGLVFDLKRHLSNEPVLARPPTAAYKLQKAFRRNKLLCSAGVAVAAALLLGIVGTTVGLLQAKTAKTLALQTRTEAEKLSVFMLEDFYDELQPSGRFETVVRLAKQALSYYDHLPPSMRTPESERNRAMAQARLAFVTSQQSQFKSASALALEAASRLEQMRHRGDQSEGTAYALALALLASSIEHSVTSDSPGVVAPLKRGIEALQPFALSAGASRRSKLLYADLLDFLSHAQTSEQGIATCHEALSILDGLGALNWSDLDAASAWGDIADSQARELLGLGRLDEAERTEKKALELAEGVVQRRPNDLRARRVLFFATDILALIEGNRFHDAAAMDWSRKYRQASEEFTRFNPSEGVAWLNLAMADYFISALLFRSGHVTDALNTARPAARAAADNGTGIFGWGGLTRLLAVWEAQLGHRLEAEEALQMGKLSLDKFTKVVSLSSRGRISSEEPIHDTERQIKHAFGEDEDVLGLARDALVRIEQSTKGEENADQLAVLNQLKRQALSDLTCAALKLRRFTDAETSARALLAMPVLPGELADVMNLDQPGDSGWAGVLLAEAQVDLGHPADALKSLEPALGVYREMQVQGITHVTFIQHFARALYIHALAQPATDEGASRCRDSLAQATNLLERLSDEAKQLHDSKELFSWISAAGKKLEPTPRPQ